MARLVSELQDHPGRWAIALLFVLLLFFPILDPALSGLFYRPPIGFTWNSDGFLEFVREAAPDIIIGSFGLCVLAWAVGLFKAQWLHRVTTPQIAYLFATLLLGPGLMVEALLKPNWGRARPKDVTLFGGDAAYTPPWEIAHECERNCSFASGHAAIAFWITAYAFLLPPKWRAWGVVAGLVFGFGVGLVRIIQGAHFFSDVISAGLIVVVINVALARLVLKQPA